MALGRPRTIDAGPAGLLTPVGRLTFEERAETQATAATGGAPSLIPAQERSLEDAVSAVPTMVSTPTSALPSPERFRPGALTYQPILPNIGPGLHPLEEYTLANQGLINSIAADISGLQRWAEAAGVRHESERLFGNPQELAASLVAYIQRAFEPGGSRAPDLQSFAEQSREGRRVFNFLNRLRENRALWQATTIEGVPEPSVAPFSQPPFTPWMPTPRPSGEPTQSPYGPPPNTPPWTPTPRPTAEPVQGPFAPPPDTPPWTPTPRPTPQMAPEEERTILYAQAAQSIQADRVRRRYAEQLERSQRG